MKKTLIAMMLCMVMCVGFVSGASARTVTFGGSGYEPLRWQVLYSNSQYTTLISEKCIACRPFGNSNNWYTSSLRSWLNNVYLYDAFASYERNAICAVDGDLIRIPSVGDMINPQFGFSSSRDACDRSRSARGSAAAINQGLWTNENGYCSYYTMTPCDRTSMYQVRTDGRIGVARIDRKNVGVRIMIKVRTSALD